MPVKSLSKVQKSVQKKKGAAKGVHANSRDAKRLQRATLREEKVLKTQQVRAKQNQPYHEVDRVTFFRDSIANKDQVLALPALKNLIQSFISHRDAEIEDVQALNRPGRPVSGREQLLLQLKAEWQKEFTSGFWVPDLTSNDNMEALRAWGGNWTTLSNIKFVRVSSDGRCSASDFPPRKA